MDERVGRLRRIFRYLKRGVFPPESVDAFTVGRGAELSEIETRLDLVECVGIVLSKEIAHRLIAEIGVIERV